MAGHQNKLSQFWQELKRRNVVRVVTVYAGAALVIIELVNNISEPLRLPDWTPTLVIVLLALSFPIVIIISWIYDLRPEGGVVKSEHSDKVRAGDMPKSSNSWKIASYISFAVIVGLIGLNVIPRIGREENPEKSIVILPVRNLGGDPEQDAICAGLTSEIISQLSKIKSFDKVVPFQSVMNIEPGKDILQISEEFGVNYILGTTYRKVGDKFRLNFSLIEAQDYKNIWQDDYERKYEEIISINTEIALEIVRKLNTYYSEEEKALIENETTQNLEAYELLQSAVYQLFQKKNIKYAYKDSLQKVIELDPGYANGWAFMASLSIFQSAGMVIPGFNKLDAIDYNQKALALDPENLNGLLNQAMIEEWWNWNYIATEVNFRKAFALAPATSFEYLISGYIDFLLKMKRYEEIPPYFSRISGRNEYEMFVYSVLGQPEKAGAAFQEMMEEGEIWAVIRFCLWRGEYERAGALADAFSLGSKLIGVIWDYAYLAITRYMTGDIPGATDLVQELKESSETSKNGMAEFNLARYYSVTGDRDSAFNYLYQAFEERCPDMSWLKADPLFDNIRQDDRYLDLYEKTGFKDYDDYRASKR